MTDAALVVGETCVMTEGTKLCAQQINHGQSEIWLEADGKEITPKRKLASNEVVNALRRLCAPEAFQIFNADYHRAVGNIASLNVPNLEVIAVELKLKP